MKRANNILVGIIIFLTLIIIGLVILLVLTLINIKDDSKESINSSDVIINGNIISFLDKTMSVSGDSYYNILNSTGKTDEELFNLIIQYLYLNNMYTKSNDEYIYKQSDIIDIAKKYVMKDNFDYISTNPIFIYDSINKTFKTKLQLDIPKAYILKSIEIYDKTETNAFVTLEIEGSYVETVTRIWEKYNIVIDIKDEFRIISIDKINKE